MSVRRRRFFPASPAPLAYRKISARDHLANERTWLAYLRTSLSIASAGVGESASLRLSRNHSDAECSSGPALHDLDDLQHNLPADSAIRPTTRSDRHHSGVVCPHNRWVLRLIASTGYTDFLSHCPRRLEILPRSIYAAARVLPSRTADRWYDQCRTRDRRRCHIRFPSGTRQVNAGQRRRGVDEIRRDCIAVGTRTNTIFTIIQDFMT